MWTIRDDPQETSIPLNMDTCNFAHMSHYGPIQPRNDQGLDGGPCYCVPLSDEWAGCKPKPVWYGERDVKSVRVFSARAIDCVIGRVKI